MKKTYNNKNNNKANTENFSNADASPSSDVVVDSKLLKNQIEVKYTDDAGYKAEFYGSVKGKDAVHLFDVCFNSDDGFLLGFIQNDEEIINISIDMKELEFDDSWEQEEINELYAMQEDMNFLMESLSKIENYVEP